jgi:hypothetical protein
MMTSATNDERVDRRSTSTFGNNQERHIDVTLPAGCWFEQPGCMPTSMTCKIDPENSGTWRAWTYTRGAASAQTFGYDDLRRLTAATGPYGSLTYVIRPAMRSADPYTYQVELRHRPR